MSYTSLHNHTEYSNLRLLDCINKVEDLIKRAYELGLNGVAITDHESVSGYIKALNHMEALKSKAEKILSENPNDDWALKVKNFKLNQGIARFLTSLVIL